MDVLCRPRNANPATAVHHHGLPEPLRTVVRDDLIAAIAMKSVEFKVNQARLEGNNQAYRPEGYRWNQHEAQEHGSGSMNPAMSLRAAAPGILPPAALDRMTECRVAQGCARAATCTSMYIVLPSRDIHYVPVTSLRASCPPATYTTSL